MIVPVMPWHCVQHYGGVSFIVMVLTGLSLLVVADSEPINKGLVALGFLVMVTALVGMFIAALFAE